MFLLILIILPMAAIAQQSPEVEAACAAVERLYPRELLDASAWQSACASAPDVETLLETLDDPLAAVLEGPEENVSTVDYYRMDGTTLGYLRLSGFRGGAALVAAFDQAFEPARFDDGIIFDLRGAEGGDVATAYHIFGRLSSARSPGVTLLKRAAGTETARETAYAIVPTGPWQLDLPVVILVDEATAWPAEALLFAAATRSSMETLGRPTRGTRGAEPQRVVISDATVVQIPTAAVRTAEGRLLRGEPFEPGVNVDDEAFFSDYRNKPDPVLARGLDELYRMLGRLQYLQGEYLRQHPSEARDSTGARKRRYDELRENLFGK